MPISLPLINRTPTGIVPPFVPHPWLRGGHAQTIAGRYLPERSSPLPAVPHLLDVDNGDRLCVLDSLPEGWGQGEPAALLVHGLAGSANAPYIVRLARKLRKRGIRVVRMNLRGAGAGFGLARGMYHSGRTADLRAVAVWLAEQAPGSPIALVGFSLGASLVLKLAAEVSTQPLEGLDCVLAANPPLNLADCCRFLQRPAGRIYDRNFVRALRKDVRRLHAHYPDLEPIDLAGVRTLFEFDDVYTAPRNGFSSADDYYTQCSAGPLIPLIDVPGLVVHAEDDPFIPPDPFRKIAFPPQLALELIPHGGHLGYLSQGRWDGDRRWLETRLATWLSAHWDRIGPDPEESTRRPPGRP